MAGYRGGGIHPVAYHRHEDVFRPVFTPRGEHDRFKRRTIQSGYRSLPINVGCGTAGNGGFGRPLRRMESIGRRRADIGRSLLPHTATADILGTNVRRRAAAGIRHGRGRFFNYYGASGGQAAACRSRIGLRRGKCRRFGRTVPLCAYGTGADGSAPHRLAGNVFMYGAD